jgi:hypothetical protein
MLSASIGFQVTGLETLISDISEASKSAYQSLSQHLSKTTK